jgi:hypothetical protein
MTSSKALYAVIIVIVIAVIGGGVFWYMQNQSSYVLNSYPAAQNIQNQVQQNNSAQTASWKTYINAQYGFELQYPASWKAPIVTSNLPKLDDPFAISIFPNTKNLSSKDFASAFLGAKDVSVDMKYVPQKELMIGGSPAYELYGSQELGGAVIIFLAKGSNLFVMEFTKANPDVANEANNYTIVHQIISTFKFTK